MTDGFRRAAGGLIERDRDISFTFDGHRYAGHPGDTLASALLANGVRLVGRSFKYHRPRGIWSAGSDEPNALVEIGTGARREPNTRATTVELVEGLEAFSQNRWPSLRFDVMAVNGLLAPLFKAGFYYKTFMWPAAFWEALYEPLIRRAAGLGHAPEGVDPDRYDKAVLHCDVLIIGGGPAGLAAALAAARAGARVVLADEDTRLGGRLLHDRHELDGDAARNWADRVRAELESLPEVTILDRTTVFGVFDGGTYGAVQRAMPDAVARGAPRQTAWRIIARQAVLAAGAVERPIAFGGNDRPGVMSAAAVRAYLHRYAVRAGREVVVFTAGDDGWRTALDVSDAGGAVTVVDARAEVAPALGTEAARRGIDVILGGRVRDAHGRAGVTAVDILDARGATRRVPADLVAVAGGWNPNVHLTCHLGGRPVWDETIAAFVPGTHASGLAVAGAAAGRLTLAAALSDGAARGLAAAAACGFDGQAPRLPRADDEPAAVRAFFHVAEARKPAFVDFQHDVTPDDIALATREGFRSPEHVKRYTTLGMATDQGKGANVVGLGILADRTGRTMAEVGTTVFRPPYTPVTIGALAGAHTGPRYRPERRTPLHAWAQARGASFVEAGPWLRAEWYARPGEAGWRDSVDREALTVRNAAGLCDVSTLGKIEVVGPDAGALLDFVYTNTMSTLAIGRVRYGLMLREDGFVFDDGTCARLAPDRFFVTTTTANAARVLQHLEFVLQVLRPDLDAAVLSVTDRWAQMSLAGPRARDILGQLVTGLDLANASFPHMSVGVATLASGHPARIYRLSFSGELAYEIGVAPSDAARVADAILAAGERFGIAPYGTEALGVLRIEKGHVGGGELTGQTTARDLGLQGLLSKTKDYIGRVPAMRPALVDPERPVLVGLKPLHAADALKTGMHLLPIGTPTTSAHDQGYVTSSCHSPTLGHTIGLGLLTNGRARIGERIRAVDLLRDSIIEAEVCHPVFVDPEGGRTRA